MAIQVYTHTEQEERELLDFLESRHYSYKPAAENEITDGKFLDQYNKELDEAEAEIDVGNYYSHAEVKKVLADRRKQLSGN